MVTSENISRSHHLALNSAHCSLAATIGALNAITVEVPDDEIEEIVDQLSEQADRLDVIYRRLQTQLEAG